MFYNIVSFQPSVHHNGLNLTLGCLLKWSRSEVFFYIDSMIITTVDFYLISVKKLSLKCDHNKIIILDVITLSGFHFINLLSAISIFNSLKFLLVISRAEQNYELFSHSKDSKFPRYPKENRRICFWKMIFTKWNTIK